MLCYLLSYIGYPVSVTSYDEYDSLSGIAVVDIIWSTGDRVNSLSLSYQTETSRANRIKFRNFLKPNCPMERIR